MNDLRVAMVFGSGGLGAGGYYNEMGLKGLKQAEAEFSVGFDYRLPEGDADFEPHLRELAQSGKYALVAVMSFGASPGLNKVADEYPAQKFAAFDARADKPNVANYASDAKGISFLAGAAAAWLSRTGKVGTLFGTEGAGYWVWVASYTAGARYVRSEVEVLYEFLPVYSPTPEQGEAAAARQYDAGVDVIMAHLDLGDRGIFAVARQRGKYALGFNGERSLDPDHIPFDVTRHLEVSVYDAIRRVVEAKFEAGATVWGMERGQYALEFSSPPHPLVTPDFLKRVEALKADINAGKFGALPPKRDDIEPFLKAQATSRKS
ncbi:MAG: BMP family ABC transporter substrate-binding protein [Chloroflexi bacterium]|nr:BMP family ABC transporter substrate-binding protein [Chloroflexota bacterium]